MPTPLSFAREKVYSGTVEVHAPAGFGMPHTLSFSIWILEILNDKGKY